MDSREATQRRFGYGLRDDCHTLALAEKGTPCGMGAGRDASGGKTSRIHDAEIGTPRISLNNAFTLRCEY